MKKLLMSGMVWLVVNSAAVNAAEVPCLQNGVAAIQVSITGNRENNPTVVGFKESVVLTPGVYRLKYDSLNGFAYRPLFLDRRVKFTNYGFTNHDAKYTLEYPAN